MSIIQKTLCAVILTAAVAGTAQPVLSTADSGADPWAGVDEIAAQLADDGQAPLRDPLSALELIKKLALSAGQLLGDELRGALKSCVLIVCAAALTGLAMTMTEDKGCLWAAELAGIAAVTATAAGSFGLVRLGAQTAAQLADWSALVLPTVTTAAASAGGVTASAAKYAAATLGMSLLSRIAAHCALPLTYSYLAVSLGAAAFDNGLLKGAAGLIKRLVTWVLTLSSSALLGYLVLSGAASASVDAVTAKSVKTALGALPVVGGITSDAAAAVIAGAGVVRSTAGLLGIAGIASVCLGPVLKLAARMLAFKMAAAVAACFAPGRLGGLIDSFGTAMGLSLGTCGLTALLLFFSLVSLMQAVAV